MENTSAHCKNLPSTKERRASTSGAIGQSFRSTCLLVSAPNQATWEASMRSRNIEDYRSLSWKGVYSSVEKDLLVLLNRKRRKQKNLYILIQFHVIFSHQILCQPLISFGLVFCKWFDAIKVTLTGTYAVLSFFLYCQFIFHLYVTIVKRIWHRKKENWSPCCTCIIFRSVYKNCFLTKHF